MANEYVNHLVVNGVTKLDLRSDTAVASDVAQGKYFHLASGERAQGALIDGDNLAYGGAYVGTAVVGSAVIYEPALVGTAVVGSAAAM